MLSCFNVADYFLSLNSEDAGDLISNLKLQKLVYYGQGFHLALYNKPLFKAKIEAWQHGPVIPVLYRKYSKCGGNAINSPKNIDFSIYNEKIREFLDEVYTVFGQFSAWKLRNMTHDELPWKENKTNGDVISHKLMKAYFKTQLI